MLIPVHCHFINHQLKIVHPEESGLHPDNIDYDNTLAVPALSPNRYDDLERHTGLGRNRG